MKKTLITVSIVLGMALSGMAQQHGGGLFQRGEMDGSNGNAISPMLPTGHGLSGDQGAESTPLGGGVLVLSALGAAYLASKKRREE